MTQRRFIQCDVFSPIPMRGNGLAVVVDAEGLSDAQMQQLANWTNLSETSFLLPPTRPGADYCVRIFTPEEELPFAGHPTLGSCVAWQHCGGVPKRAGRVVQECGVGLVEVDISGERPAFVAPPTQCSRLPAEEQQRIVDALGLDPINVVRCAYLDNGPQWFVLELSNAEAVLAIDSSRAGALGAGMYGFIGPHSAGTECDFEVRMLAPASGIVEDPITGSLNSALACWMAEEGRLERNVVIAQGTCIGRQGRVFVRSDAAGKILIGGDVQVLIDGMLAI